MGRLPLIAAAASLACVAAGCECEGRPGARPLPAARGQPESQTLLPPAARRDDLPPVTPALELTVHADGFVLDNAALLATWPVPDRDRVVAARPPGDDAWPRVLARVRADLDEPGYRIGALHAAFERAARIERARAGEHAPIAFSVRAAASAPWGLVLRGIYTAALAGWAEPRFVLRSAQDERWLSVPTPRSSAPDPAAREALERMRAELSGAPSGPASADPASPASADPASPASADPASPASADPASPASADPASPAAPPSTGPARIAVHLTESRTVTLARDGAPLAGECGTLPAPDVPSIVHCVEVAAGGARTIDAVVLSAAQTLPWSEVAPLLEALRARHDVRIGVAAGATADPSALSPRSRGSSR